MESLRPKSRFALKEWAVVEKALSEGKQALLLRKGGLVDGPSGFQPEHSSFYIYPTYHHQQRDGIKKEFEGLLKNIPLDSRPGEVTLSIFVEVSEAFREEKAEALSRLDTLHIFNSSEVDRRFYYGRKEGITVLFLNIYRLMKPIRLPVLPRYSGCRSWVELEASLNAGSCLPIKAPTPDSGEVQGI